MHAKSDENNIWIVAVVSYSTTTRRYENLPKKVKMIFSRGKTIT